MSRRTDGGAALTLLRRLPIAILEARTIEQVLTVIARHVTEALGYEDCVIYVRDTNNMLVQTAAWGPKCPDGQQIIEPLRLHFGQGIVGTAAATQKTQRVTDTRLLDSYVPDIAGGLSELAVPIRYGDDLLGVIDSEHPDLGFYTAEDAELITTIAAIAAAQLRAAMIADEQRATIGELRQAQRELSASVLTDSLTGIGNRRYFEERLAGVVASDERFSLCAMDLDGFKQVNDTFGHHEGDDLLRLAASVLEDRLCPLNAIVARIGGDEFAAIAPMGSDFTTGCLAVVQTISRVFGERYAHLALGMSAGVAHGTTDDVWYNADDALYVAKTTGGNRVTVFDPLDPRTIERSRQRLTYQASR